MRQTIEILILSVLGSCLVGCDGATGRESVSGHVTLDGKPVDGGAISFVPLTGIEGPTVGANIVDGSYRIPKAQGPVVGRYRVEIRWPRPTKKKVPVMAGIPDSDMRNQLAEAVPDKFHSESVLEVEIKKSRNECDFELTSSSGNISDK